jgi:tripartite-type tricarboxylate transporter receptor subunit TctC
MKTSAPRRVAAALAAPLFATLTASAAAQPAYPSKPVTMVVPYAPGGVADALARAIAARLSGSLKQQVLVDNKPGGNTVIGAQAVARAAADGYTLLLTAEATLAMNPSLYAKLPYNVEKSFAPVIALAQVPQSLVVANSTPAKTLPGFIALAKEQPGKLSYATLGIGSTAHLNFELFQKATGIKLGEVSYKGAAPALTDLIGGHVGAMIVSTGLVAPQAKAGKLRVLATSGSARSALLPDVPTFAEAGLADFAPASWFALLTVAGTPPEIARRLNAEVARVLADPGFKSETLDRLSLEPLGGTPEDLAALIRTETQRWGAVIRDAGVKLE